MKYLLDTNMCIFLMKNNTSVVNKYKENKKKGIAISSITAAELYFGVCNSANPIKNGENLAKFLIGLKILEFDSISAMEYGNLRAKLWKKGMPIGPLDMLIASHAKSKGLIIVTNNVHEFERIDGLLIEDWLS